MRDKFWSFQNKSEKIGELFLYGDISDCSWWGDEVTPKDFKADLDALGDIDELRVYVNSGGGDVFAGWAIINILQRHKAKKVGFNDGLAASIAFDILMSMDEVVAMKNCLFMTHNCWTFAIGNRHKLRSQADTMEKIDGMLADTEAGKSGKTRDEIMALRDAETWFTADEALAEGFADEVRDGAQLAASLDGNFLVMGKERFVLSRFKDLPERLRAALPHAEPGGDMTEVEAKAGNTITPPGLAGCAGSSPEGSVHAEGIAAGETQPPLCSKPINGGESQPVEDIRPAEEQDKALDALKAQRADFKRIREKILGGHQNG